MLREDDSAYYPEIQQKRRHHTVEIMRRLQAKLLCLGDYSSCSGNRSGKGSSSSTSFKVEVMESSSSSQGQGQGQGPAAVTIFGAISVSGRQRVMEDALSIRPNLCSPPINRYRPVDFFAIYDGHGGRHVATLCSERMHVLLEEELMREQNNADMSGSNSSSRRRTQSTLEGQNGEETTWKGVLRRCFLRMDEMASRTCSECGSLGHQCDCPPDTLGITGSTAVVAVLTEDALIVANCGDSRAVLCRGGRAIPLSFDHKPDRQEERARIEASGGQVVFADGARVEGILAMSRAIGDSYLKPFVTSEPEITFTKRVREDECLILASDGLWNVLSSEMACAVAKECLRVEDSIRDRRFRPWVEHNGRGATFTSPSASAAALLTRLALGRNSSDNISVIVVDLTRNRPGG